MSRNFLVIDPAERPDVLRGLASPARARILRLLHRRPGLNVNDIAEALNLPQSTVSSNLQILESAGLIRTETQKGRKGNQKLCFSAFDEVLVMLRDDVSGVNANAIEVAMPIGLYTSCEVSAPCGLCSPRGVIGLLDVPGTFLDPDRMNAGLMWFTRGFVEYQFPNNARHVGKAITALELSFELSSEVPGTASDWPSDITVAVNGRELGVWTSPGDFGDQRGLYTPDWWKLKGSQYGMLKSWRVTPDGAFVDGVKNLAADFEGSRLLRPPFDSGEDRGQAGRAPSGRRQHLRPRLRQLRSGHRAEAHDRVVSAGKAPLRAVRAPLPFRRTGARGSR